MGTERDRGDGTEGEKQRERGCELMRKTYKVFCSKEVQTKKCTKLQS